MSNITLPTKNHRTLLVLDASEGFDEVVAERFNRVLQSVNNENIKVDIATLRPQASSSVALVPGAAFSGMDYEDDSEDITIEDVEKAARRASYDQILIAKGLRG